METHGSREANWTGKVSPLLLSRTAPSVFLSDRLSSQFSLPGDLILSLLVGAKLSTL